MSVNFDYIFEFENGIFEQSIYDQCTIPEGPSNRQQQIEEKVNIMLQVFNNIKGLKNFETFIIIDSVTYKICLCKN